MMDAEDVSRVFQGLEDALQKVEVARGDAKQYAEQSEAFMQHLQGVSEQIEGSDPRLAAFGHKLSQEETFASKSSELRSLFATKPEARTFNSKY
jgi:hypothetical protein